MPRLNRRSRQVLEQLSFRDHCALVEPLLLAKLPANSRARVARTLRAWRQLPAKGPQSDAAPAPIHARIANILAAKTAGGLVDYLRLVAGKKAVVGPRFLFEAHVLHHDVESGPKRRRSASPRR